MGRRAKEPDFVCPNCGADVPGGASSCPECGSDENTGWSDRTYLDGISLPYEDETNDPAEERRGGVLGSAGGLWAVVAGLLLALSLYLLLRSAG